MKNKIYIAGPMSGKDCYNFEEFFVAAHTLKKAGFEVINPAQVDCERMLWGEVYTPDQYGDILIKDLTILNEEAGCLYMLDGWVDSRGATIEFQFATAIGLKALSQQEFRDAVESLPMSSEEDIMRDLIEGVMNERV